MGPTRFASFTAPDSSLSVVYRSPIFGKGDGIRQNGLAIESAREEFDDLSESEAQARPINDVLLSPEQAQTKTSKHAYTQHFQRQESNQEGSFHKRKLVEHTGLREQHVRTLTTILHRCVLEGNYLQAGHALGMLLRTEVNGRFLDIRKHYRWGIGAEILVCRRLNERSCDGNETYLYEHPATPAQPQEEVTQAEDLASHIEQAKTYYRRLILQYPYRRIGQRNLDPLDLYPALFGLWIYQIQVQHQSSIAKCRSNHESSKDSDRSVEETPAAFHVTLERAKGVAGELDELLLSPPYSDSDRLLNLRAMIHCWLSDLRNHLDPSNREVRFTDDLTRNQDV